MKYRRLLGAGLMVSLGIGPGCNLILGLQDFEDAPSTGTGGERGGGGNGAGGGNGSSLCEQAGTISCYDGSARTENVGACKAGTQTCDAQTMTYGDCVGQILPGTEDCGRVGDEDCDGVACSDVIWAKSFPDIGTRPRDKFLMATDPQGNIYLSGGFSETVDFGGGPLVPVDTDVFLAKLDKDGNQLWSYRFGEAAAEGAEAIAVDRRGNVTIAGQFSGTLNFGLGPLTNQGQGKFFVATFDPEGTPLHSKSWAGGSSAYTRIFDVAVDSEQNVILSGALIGTLDFGGGVSVTSAGGSDVHVWDSFLVKLTSNLDGVWSTVYGDPDNEWANIFVRIDGSDSIIMGGDFRGQMRVGSTMMSATRRTPFLAKLAAGGTALWAYPFPTLNGIESNLRGLAVDRQGDAFISGFIGGDVRFDTEAVLTGPGGYVAKFDASGTNRYSAIHPGAQVNELATDATGSILMAGALQRAVDFGGGPLGSASSFYMVKRKPDGGHLWGKAFATTNPSDGISALSVEPVGNTTYLAGRLSEGTVDFGNGPVGPGLYVARFNP